MRQRFILLAFFTISGVSSGCAIYRAQPLDPREELESLRRITLEGLSIAFTHPGEGSRFAPAAFNLADGLDESELVAVALALNPDLAARRLEVGEAQSQLISAGLWPNPEVGLDLRPGVAGSAGYTADASLLADLLKGWERSARRGAARARIEEAKAEVVAEEWKVARQARLARLEVLAGERLSALFEEEARLRRRALELVRERRGLGEATALEAALSELELAEVERQGRQAKSRLEQARRELNRLLGLPPEYELELAGAGQPPPAMAIPAELPAVSSRELEDRLVRGRFELRAQEAAYRRAEEELRLAVYRQYPDFKIGPSFNREPEGSLFLGVGASLEIPLFDRNQGEIAEKLKRRERARAEYAALLHRLRAGAAAAWLELERAHEDVKAVQQGVEPLLAQIEGLLERGMRARELNILDWLAAEQRFLATRRSLAEAFSSWQRAVVELETAVGASLDDLQAEKIKDQETEKIKRSSS